jgi:SAM-dependent methyltransferase
VVRTLARRVASIPGLQGLAHWALSMRDRRGAKVHPLDARLGIDTGGVVSNIFLTDGEDATVYLGCVPSVLTPVLRTIPHPESASFTDLGCGKGRGLAVAHAFPFKSLRGIELSAPLARIARRNAEVIARANPAGPPIEIVQGDATAPSAPEGDLVYFMYHPFGEASIRRLCAALAEQARGQRRVFVVYENPVHGDVFDAERTFHRWFAGTLPYSPEELGVSVDVDETIIVWANDAAGPAPEPADAEIVVLIPGWRVETKPRAAT